MAYGMQIYNSDNSLAYDSTSPGGVFIRFVVLPPGTSHVTVETAGKENFTIEYASKTLVIYPLVIGSHYWSLFAGNAGSNQTPNITWYDNTYMPPGESRKQTILMVFAK
jgi:hypothetical protein